MHVAGVPLWALVLLACVVAPLIIRAWIDAEQRRAKKRTADLLQPFEHPSTARSPLASAARVERVEDDAANGGPRASMGGRN